MSDCSAPDFESAPFPAVTHVAPITRRSRPTLEDELDRAFSHIAVGSQAERNHAIVRHYFGLDGQGGVTMEVAGTVHGLTRESVRIKIETVSHLLRHYHHSGGQFPMLGKILALLEAEAPVRADVVEQMLVDKGWVRHPFRIEGVLSLCNILRQPLILAPILEFNGERWLLLRNQMGMHKKGLYSLAHQAMSSMNKCVSHHGAIYLPQQAERLQLKSPEKARRLIAQLAATRKDLRTAASNPDWIWFTDSPRSCLRNRLLKIFSVIESGDLSEIHAGIQRNYRKTRPTTDDLPVPMTVLADILREMPDIELQGNRVRCLKRPDPDEHLIGVEADLIRFMAQHIGRPAKRVAITALASTKKEQYALSMSLSFSCVLTGTARNGYQLVGTPWPLETPT